MLLTALATTGRKTDLVVFIDPAAERLEILKQ